MIDEREPPPPYIKSIPFGRHLFLLFFFHGDRNAATGSHLVARTGPSPASRPAIGCGAAMTSTTANGGSARRVGGGGRDRDVVALAFLFLFLFLRPIFLLAPDQSGRAERGRRLTRPIGRLADVRLAEKRRRHSLPSSGNKLRLMVALTEFYRVSRLADFPRFQRVSTNVFFFLLSSILPLRYQDLACR